MNIFKGLKDLVTGKGFLSKTIETITDYFPDPVAKAEIAAKLQELEIERERAMTEAMHLASVDLNNRIKEQEGTASDLKAIPIVGPILIFARGAQRPIWGFATLYFDYQLFSGALADITEQQTQLLIIINFLVLGFLFGERAVKNIMPLFINLMGAKSKT